jgi:hypothetical protein
MISLRLAILAVLAAAALAACFAYFVTPPPLVEADEQSAPTVADVPSSTAVAPEIFGKFRTEEDFERAAKTILKRLPDAQASADIDQPIGRIPLPKRRPFPR